MFETVVEFLRVYKALLLANLSDILFLPPSSNNPSNPYGRKAGQQQQKTANQHYNKG